MSRDLLPAISPQKYYQPEKWTSRHRMIVAAELTGDTNKGIAERFGMTESRVSIILNDPRADLERKTLGLQVAKGITDAQVKLKLASSAAVDELIEELECSPDERMRHKAANSILDRAGYSKIRKEIKIAPSIPESVGAVMKEVLDEMQNIEEADYEVLEPELEEEVINEF